MNFEDLWNILWLLLIVPPIVYLYIKRSPRGNIKFSTLVNLKKIKPSTSLKVRHILIALRIIALVLLVFALMRPQKGIEETKVKAEGIDAILAIDVSGSMMAEDFTMDGKRYNRLDVVKKVVEDFVKRRQNDRIGIVTFAGRPYTLCPLTLDYGVLLQFLERAKIGMIEDGTAIGSGISTSLNRLKKTESKSKVIILLTDGVNNMGKIDPQNAAELAKALGVKIYTIGAGTRGKVPYPVKDFFGNKVYQWVIIDLDEDSLRSIAETTGGKYFRATDAASLKKIYADIDTLEKTKIEANIYMQYKELFKPFVLLAMAFILIEVVLANTRFKTIP